MSLMIFDKQTKAKRHNHVDTENTEWLPEEDRQGEKERGKWRFKYLVLDEN